MHISLEELHTLPSIETDNLEQAFPFLEQIKTGSMEK
jgi:hypothetical protein